MITQRKKWKKHLNLYLEEMDWRLLGDLAERERRSMSSLVRSLICTEAARRGLVTAPAQQEGAK